MVLFSFGVDSEQVRVRLGMLWADVVVCGFAGLGRGRVGGRLSNASKCLHESFGAFPLAFNTVNALADRLVGTGAGVCDFLTVCTDSWLGGGLSNTSKCFHESF